VYALRCTSLWQESRPRYRNPRRNHLILLLSLKAGLRAGEIAKLTWDMVAGPTGKIGHVIELRDCAAKKKSGRLIPIHPSLRAALAAWRKMTTGTGPVIRSERGGPMTPVSIVRDCLSGRRPGRLLVAFRPPNVHHPGRPAGSQGRRLAAKRTIAPKSLDRFKQRIRYITRRGKGVNIKTTIEELAQYMRGWRGYTASQFSILGPTKADFKVQTVERIINHITVERRGPCPQANGPRFR
jgi:hypothetical protein